MLDVCVRPAMLDDDGLLGASSAGTRSEGSRPGADLGKVVWTPVLGKVLGWIGSICSDKVGEVFATLS